MLDKIAFVKSDNEFAEFIQQEKDKLFNNFKGQKLQFPATFSNKTMSEISGSFLD